MKCVGGFHFHIPTLKTFFHCRIVELLDFSFRHPFGLNKAKIKKALTLRLLNSSEIWICNFPRH